MRKLLTMVVEVRAVYVNPCLCTVPDVMVGMGFSPEEIQESLAKMKYDEITATYLLLGRKSSEVRATRWIVVDIFVLVHSISRVQSF